MSKARSVVSGQWSVVKFMDGVHDFDAAHLTINLERVRLCRQGAAGILPAVLFSDLSAGKMPAAG